VFPASQNAGKTAAMIAASNGSTEILKAIGRGPALLDLKDADGGTAAMTAAVHKHGSVLDFVRLPRAQTDRFRSRHRARLPTGREPAIAPVVTNAPIALVPRSGPGKSASAPKPTGSFSSGVTDGRARRFARSRGGSAIRPREKAFSSQKDFLRAFRV
jgi:hypothetical protein